MKVKQNGVWKNLGGFGPEILGDYVLLTPDMISGSIGWSTQRYIGTDSKLIIGNNLGSTSLRNLFKGNTVVKSVIILNNFATNMNYMFEGSQSTELDLSSFDISNVTNMGGIFRDSKVLKLDLSSFDTSNVTNMEEMFYNSKVLKLDLSSFNTSKVTNMNYMFYNSQSTELDLSSFDTSKVTRMVSMFAGSSATTGYARTQADADRFNASSGKPAGLTFVVKP